MAAEAGGGSSCKRRTAARRATCSEIAPGIVAAVCVRDHWEEMSDDERNWCVNIICSEVEREGDHWDERVRIQRNSTSADRPCACVLPLLLGKSLSKTQRSRVHQMLVLALTHAIDEVRWYVASGIGVYLWTIDRELALRCANVLATEAMLVQSRNRRRFRALAIKYIR